jgi:pimeloyl-ACP methyl ester carboxylesterase
LISLLSKFAAGISICTALAATAPSALAMDVYLFRGLAGVPFSVGLDDLENKLKASGIYAQTLAHTQWQEVYLKIKKRGTKEVAFVGHSMGALSAISLTRKLRGSGVRVAYLGLIDIPGTGTTAPKNASWAESYVSSQPGFGLLKINPSHKNLVVNTRVPKTVHITIDDSERVHDAIISAVWLADASIGRAPRTVTAFAPSYSSRKADSGRKFDWMTTSAIQGSVAKKRTFAIAPFRFK